MSTAVPKAAFDWLPLALVPLLALGALPLVGSPLKFSDTPVEFKLPPPRLGEHTEKVLKDVLGYS